MSEEMDINSEDLFLAEVMDNENNGNCNESTEESMPFGLNRLLREPLRLTKTKLDFTHVSQTPRNPLFANNDRKRKNPTRRCLSEVLDNSSSFISPELNLSPNIFQWVHKGRQSEDMSSDEQNCSLEMTPIFTHMKTTSSGENTENDSLVANISMTSPIFSSSEINPLKRPIVPKIRKSNSLVSSTTKRNVPFVRCHSANEATIMKAVQMSCADPSLIGDFSKSYALPLIPGKHQDLKSISVEVLAQVLNGDYEDLIEKYTVVDCRYPYEYNGGHIRGAKNIYSQEAILQEFLKSSPLDVPPTDQKHNKRHILVFHCEFSSERGPTLSRFLRNTDRSTNKDFYPQLHHPEIYLLEGGYKAFFEKYRHLCEPSDYLPMHSKDHEQELKRFRAIVKTLSTDYKTFGSVLKTGHKAY